MYSNRGRNSSELLIGYDTQGRQGYHTIMIIPTCTLGKHFYKSHNDNNNDNNDNNYYSDNYSNSAYG